MTIEQQLLQKTLEAELMKDVSLTIRLSHASEEIKINAIKSLIETLSQLVKTS